MYFFVHVSGMMSSTFARPRIVCGDVIRSMDTDQLKDQTKFLL